MSRSRFYRECQDQGCYRRQSPGQSFYRRECQGQGCYRGYFQGQVYYIGKWQSQGFIKENVSDQGCLGRCQGQVFYRVWRPSVDKAVMDEIFKVNFIIDEGEDHDISASTPRRIHHAFWNINTDRFRYRRVKVIVCSQILEYKCEGHHVQGSISGDVSEPPLIVRSRAPLAVAPRPHAINPALITLVLTSVVL